MMCLRVGSLGAGAVCWRTSHSDWWTGQWILNLELLVFALDGERGFQGSPGCTLHHPVSGAIIELLRRGLLQQACDGSRGHSVGRGLRVVTLGLGEEHEMQRVEGSATHAAPT